MASVKRKFPLPKMNVLGPTGLTVNVTAFVLTLLSYLSVFQLIFTPVVGAILGILALVSSAVGLTMTVIARNEIVTNVQSGDSLAISGMVVGIVMCALSASAITLWFILFT